jgi:hypothetical protein
VRISEISPKLVKKAKKFVATLVTLYKKYLLANDRINQMITESVILLSDLDSINIFWCLQSRSLFLSELVIKWIWEIKILKI